MIQMLWQEAVLQKVAKHLLELCCREKKLVLPKVGGFQNCMHALYSQKKNVRLYKTPVYMCNANLKCMLLILVSVAKRNCPLHLFEIEVHNY